MMVLLHMQHPCCHVMMETGGEHTTRCHVSGAAPTVRKRREQAASSARAPKIPVSVANSSQVGGLSVCRHAAWMLAFGCKDGNRSSAPTGAKLQLITISIPSRAMMTVTQVSLVCVGRSMHETPL